MKLTKGHKMAVGAIALLLILAVSGTFDTEGRVIPVDVTLSRIGINPTLQIQSVDVGYGQAACKINPLGSYLPFTFTDTGKISVTAGGVTESMYYSVNAGELKTYKFSMCLPIGVYPMTVKVNSMDGAFVDDETVLGINVVPKK